MRNPSTKSAIGIALAYAILAGGWVLLTHLGLNARMTDPHNYVRYDAPTDVLFAVLTALLIFILMRRELTAQMQANEALRRSRDELELRVQQRTEALAAERNKLLLIMDAMPDGVCIINQGYDLEYVNPALEKQWGPVQGQKCYAYFNDRTEPCPECGNAEVLAGKTVRSEWTSAKVPKTFELVATPLTDLDGKVVKLEILHDVTERRAAEKEAARLLRQIDAERRLSQAIIENAPASIALFDGATLRVKWVNKQYHERLPQPFRDADVAGLELVELFPDAPNNGMLDTFRTVASTGVPSSEAELPYWEASRGWTYWQRSLLPLSTGDQDVPDLLLVAHDVSEQVLARKRLEEMGAANGRRAEELRHAHAELESRARELTALLDISHDLASTLSSRPLLELILDHLKTMVDYTGATVVTLYEDEGITVVAYRGPLPQEEILGAWASIDHTPGFREILRCREPVIIADLQGDAPLARQITATASPQVLWSLGASRSWLGVPLIIKDRVIGLLRLDHVTPNYFTPHHAQLAMAIANQAAVAMENARLYEEALKIATVEERQRMARELHDSVSQALYGIALGAHAAREQVDRAPEKLADTLDYLLALAETAVTEMRALIFELRPDSLEQEGLVVGLRRLAGMIRARDQLDVSVDLGEEPPVSLDAKEVLYRIAQEALRNTVKHAQAKAARLRLYAEDGWAVLEAVDDGTGFDSAGRYPGHLGLRSMRERVAQVGGAVEIESAPSRGTCVRARIPFAQLIHPRPAAGVGPSDNSAGRNNGGGRGSFGRLAAGETLRPPRGRPSTPT